MTPTVSIPVAVATMGALLAIQFILAVRLKGIGGLILGTQAVYWSLAYVIRPLYLYLARPATTLELGDPRLMNTGYRQGLDQVVWLAVLGQAAFLATALIMRRTFTSKQTLTASIKNNQGGALLGVALVFWVLGWFTRFVSLGELASVTTILRSLGPIGACLLILLIPDAKHRWFPPLVALVALGEVYEAFSDASKTALIIPVLALLVRWMREHRKGIVKRTIALGAIVIIGFLAVQPLKGVQTATRVSELHSGPAAAVDGSLLSILERFDGASAVTDAVFLGPGRWLSTQQFISRTLTYATPGLGDGVTLGQRWTREVRSNTIINQYQDVSLAAGSTAEGYALRGTLGVVLENIVLALATVATARCVQSRSPWLLLGGATVLFSTTLFELGFLGLVQRINRIELLEICALVLMPFFHSIIAKFRTTAERPDPATPAQPVAPAAVQPQPRLAHR